MTTKAQQDYEDMRVFVFDEATQTGLRVKPPIRIREVQWDGGASVMITTDHVIKIMSKDSHIETTIPHGDSKDPEWRFMVKARVANAVTVLATQTK
jgi:hypothetical protein